MIIVPDIMVYVSGSTASMSYSSQLLRLWEQRAFDIAASEPILQDLERVLLYPAVMKVHKLDRAEIVEYVTNIRSGAVLVPGTTPVSVSPDPDDNKLFSCAVEAGAEYLVSKDKRHVLSIASYEGVQTITPQDFIEEVVQLEKAA